MNTITRRDALLGASAAVAVAGIPTPTHAVAEVDPVIGLVERLKAAWKARIAAHNAYEEAAHERGFNVVADHPTTLVKTSDGEYLWGPEEIRRAATDGRR